MYNVHTMVTVSSHTLTAGLRLARYTDDPMLKSAVQLLLKAPSDREVTPAELRAMKLVEKMEQAYLVLNGRPIA